MGFSKVQFNYSHGDLNVVAYEFAARGSIQNVWLDDLSASIRTTIINK
jgi:hypothetical protein